MTYQPPQPPQGPYQPPYQPPYPPPGHAGGLDYYGAPAQDPLAPARRASTLMYIVGGLMLALGTCLGIVLANFDALMRNPDFARGVSQSGNFSAEDLRLALQVVTVTGGLIGVALIVLAVFVRRGGLGAVVTGLVLTSLLVLYFGLETAMVFVRGRNMAPPAVCGGLCFVGVPLALFLTQLIFLIQAAKASGRVREARDQYAQQYWQYAYQQQMYQQQAQNPTHVPPPLQRPTPPPPSGERDPNDPGF